MAHARTLSSPDELSVYIAKRLMQQEAPSLLWITMHDIDVAHSGAYSLYIEGIRRTDRLCAELWKAVQENPNTPATQHSSSFPISGETPTTTPAATDSSTIALATPQAAPLG